MKDDNEKTVKPYRINPPDTCRYCGKASMLLFASVRGCVLCHGRKEEIKQARQWATPGTRLAVSFRPPLTKPTTSPSPWLYDVDTQDVIVHSSEETEQAFSLIVRRLSDDAYFRMNYYKAGAESGLPKTELITDVGVDDVH